MCRGDIVFVWCTFCNILHAYKNFSKSQRVSPPSANPRLRVSCSVSGGLSGADYCVNPRDPSTSANVRPYTSSSLPWRGRGTDSAHGTGRSWPQEQQPMGGAGIRAGGLPPWRWGNFSSPPWRWGDCWLFVPALAVGGWGISPTRRGS